MTAPGVGVRCGAGADRLVAEFVPRYELDVKRTRRRGGGAGGDEGRRRGGGAGGEGRKGRRSKDDERLSARLEAGLDDQPRLLFCLHLSRNSSTRWICATCAAKPTPPLAPLATKLPSSSPYWLPSRNLSHSASASFASESVRHHDNGNQDHDASPPASPSNSLASLSAAATALA